MDKKTILKFDSSIISFENFIEQFEKKSVQRILIFLKDFGIDKRTYDVIFERLGKKSTYQKIADKHGVSISRTIQIYKKGIYKINHPVRSYAVNFYLEMAG